MNLEHPRHLADGRPLLEQAASEGQLIGLGRTAEVHAALGSIHGHFLHPPERHLRRSRVRNRTDSHDPIAYDCGLMARRSR